MKLAFRLLEIGVSYGQKGYADIVVILWGPSEGLRANSSAKVPDQNSGEGTSQPKFSLRRPPPCSIKLGTGCTRATGLRNQKEESNPEQPFQSDSRAHPPQAFLKPNLYYKILVNFHRERGRQLHTRRHVSMPPTASRH